MKPQALFAPRIWVEFSLGNQGDIQVRLRRIVIECLAHLDQSDAKVDTILQYLRELLTKLDVCNDQAIMSRKQWLRLRSYVCIERDDASVLASSSKDLKARKRALSGHPKLRKCKHGKSYGKCPLCNACPHGNARELCKVCSGCPHGRAKNKCRTCVGCPHGRWKNECAECNACPHGRAGPSCHICNGCPHGHRKSNCNLCSACPHGKLRRGCVRCVPCPHGKIKSHCAKCKDCGHGKLKYNCSICGLVSLRRFFTAFFVCS